MKKIISLLSAVAMLALAVVPASAALEYIDDGGDYIISTLPTDDEVAAFEPKVNISAKKITSASELTAIDEDMLTIGVTTKAYAKYQKKLTTLDVYKVTVEVSDLGDVVNGYNEDYDDVYFGIYDITVGYNPANLPADYQLYALSYTMPGERGQAGVAISTQNGNLNTVFNAGGVKASETYPAQNVAVENATCKFEYILAYPTTTEPVSLPYASSKITYQRNTQNPATINVTGNDLVLGEKEPDPVEEFEYRAKRELKDTDGETVIGYAWDLTINGFDSTKTYTATFTAGGEEKVNELNFDNAEIGAGASVAFAALLKTTRTAVELALAKN